jgi:phosphoglucosamine mutase
VLELMRQHGCNIGGEPSGHIILSDYATTGDGLIAALQALAVMVTDGRRASEVLRVFAPLPQIMKNVRLNGGAPLDDKAVRAAIASGETRLGATGRLLVRKSGTEPLIRVMAEGENEKLVGQVVDDVATAIALVAKA